MKKYIVQLITVVLFMSIFSSSISAANCETFTPYYGDSVISSNSIGRYTIQDTYWRTGSLTEFNSSTDTFEHEVIFYNYNGSAYATTYDFWNSELPDSYIDVQAFDGGNEYNIAVGSYDPDTISASTWYETIIYFDSTNSSQSYYKIQCAEGYSQLGIESPWAVYQTTTSRVIPFKDPFKAPESRSWNYEWENNGTMNSAADYFHVGDWCAGNISSTTDVDYWDFNVNTTRTYNFKLILPDNGITPDYDIQIYNNSGTLVTGSYGGAGSNEEFSKYLSTGHYYVKIFTYSSSATSDSQNYQMIVY